MLKRGHGTSLEKEHSNWGMLRIIEKLSQYSMAVGQHLILSCNIMEFSSKKIDFVVACWN